MNTFRLIQSGLTDAATNMAIDEALFLCYREETSTPTLRFYGWDPASFSIGVSQNAQQLCLKAPFVRRPTGGGALLHDNELTYAFIASCRDLGLSSSIRESYAALTSFLIKTYESLGLRARFAKDCEPPEPVDKHTIASFCQSRHEEYDVIINGTKVGGNAQKRRKNIFLQHGSMPLKLISQLKKEDVGFDSLAQALVGAFSRHFGVTLIRGVLTHEERSCAEQLKDEKYRDKNWNEYGKSDNAKARVA